VEFFFQVAEGKKVEKIHNLLKYPLSTIFIDFKLFYSKF
jgi:hypothetical protein